MNELPLGTVVAVTIPRGMFPPELTARERALVLKLSILPKLTLDQLKNIVHFATIHRGVRRWVGSGRVSRWSQS